MDIGQSFSPTQAPQGYGQNGQPGRGPAAPVMDAIKILSFRVPQILGAGSPVAPGLLSGFGGNPGSGLSNSALMNQWLQRFFGQGLGVAGPMPTPSPQDVSAPMGGGSPFASPSAGGPSAVTSPSSPVSAAPSPIPTPRAPSGVPMSPLTNYFANTGGAFDSFGGYGGLGGFGPGSAYWSSPSFTVRNNGGGGGVGGGTFQDPSDPVTA